MNVEVQLNQSIIYIYRINIEDSIFEIKEDAMSAEKEVI